MVMKLGTNGLTMRRWVKGGLGLMLGCGLSWAVSAQTIQGLSAPNKVYDNGETVPLRVTLLSHTQACGLLISDALGREQRLVALPGQDVTASLSFPEDGRFRVRVSGKPLLQGYELLFACEGEAQHMVTVENSAKRAKRLAAEAAAKKAEQEAAAKAAAEAEAARQRAAKEAAITAAEEAATRAVLEKKARERAAALAKAKRDAEIKALREQIRAAKERGPMDRLRELFSSDDGGGDSQAAGDEKMSCNVTSETPVDDKDKQCLYTCSDGSIEGRTRAKSVDCPKYINSANS